MFKYGSDKGTSYGPVWYGQNTNFDKGDHKHHILTSAYAYLDTLWIHGYVSEKAMYPMLEEQMPGSGTASPTCSRPTAATESPPPLPVWC